MSIDQTLQLFRAEVSELVPYFIDELIWQREEATEEHYQLLICDIIEQNFSFRQDIYALFSWMGIGDDFFFENDLASTTSFKEFFTMFRNNGGGLVVLRFFLNRLEQIDGEYSVPTVKDW